MLKTRALWPQAKITLLCRNGLGAFFVRTGLVDDLVEVKKGDGKSYALAKSQIRDRGVLDLILAPHTSVRTTLLCHSIKAKEKISFKKSWNKLVFQKRLDWPVHLPEALRQLFLLTPFDSELADKMILYANNLGHQKKSAQNLLTPVPDWASMSIRERLGATQFADEWTKIPQAAQDAVKLNSPVMLFPGSVWATKKWTADGFLQLAVNLQKKGHTILWMGGPGEEALVNDLARRLPGSYELAGKTSVLQTCLLMTKCRLVVGNDSASSHMAAAANTPVITVMGPTILEFGYRPWSSHAFIVEREGLLCRPCAKHGSKKCPRGTHECMTHISAEEVTQQTSQVLG